ncbi:hypothetical protein [Methylophaga sp. OBS4]|nr:hypothetical protein [Methylophaga sp. OBS4]MCX4187042.1 hypothetical protein [Methylophaga sp. OBS4]
MQDRACYVVFGMTKEAITLNAVDKVISLIRVASEIIGSVSAVHL